MRKQCYKSQHSLVELRFEFQNRNQGDWPNGEYKDPELIPSPKHTKITVICRATIDEKKTITYQERPATAKEIRNESQDKQEGWTSDVVKSCSPRQVTHNWRIITLQRFSQSSESSEVCGGLCSLAALHWEGELPEHLTQKASRA